MGTHSPPVLEPDDLNDTDRAILNLLVDGRVTPPMAADRLEKSREYVSERLIRMREHDHVERIAPGLYELIEDPRHDSGTVTNADKDERIKSLQIELEEREQEIDELKHRLANVPNHSGSVDIEAVERALDDIEAAAEHGDGSALQDALRRARDALDR